MRRVLKLLLWLLAIGAVVFCAVPFGRRAPLPVPQRWDGRAAAEARAEGPVRAGAARVRIPVAKGAALAGYPALPARRWDGSGSDVHARALVLESGGLRQIVVALELLLIPPGLEAEIFRRAGLPDTSCALIAATHTHSGPGGTWRSPLAGLLGNGGFDGAQRDAIAQAAAQAIQQAVAALQPARVRVASVQTDLAVARSAGPTDARLSVVTADGAAGGAIGTLVTYAMHPTVYGRGSRKLSGDWPGAAAARIERDRGGVALVLQGALGNASWRRGEDDPDHAVERLGGQVAQRVRTALPFAGPPAESLACRVSLVSLPAPQAGPGVPWPLRRAAANALALFADPAVVPRVELSIGPARFAGVAAEPVGALAREDVQLIGLADGYVGYVETPEALAAGTGESRRTYYGPRLAEALGLRLVADSLQVKTVR